MNFKIANGFSNYVMILIYVSDVIQYEARVRQRRQMRKKIKYGERFLFLAKVVGDSQINLATNFLNWRKSEKAPDAHCASGGSLTRQLSGYPGYLPLSHGEYPG